MINFHVFRHGETDWNAEGRFQGHVDIALNDKGRSQAKALGLKLAPDHRLDAILASDLSRSFETAQIVAKELGLAESRIFRDPGIKEAFLGDAQGLTISEIVTQFGHGVLERWKSNEVSDADICYPNGESGRQVIARTFETLKRFSRAHPEFQSVGISTHGGVIRRLIHEVVLNTPGAQVPEHIAIPNGVVYQVTYDPGSEEWRMLLA